ncbi:MAG TPA: hypothetical protein DCW29_15200, partial [Janthinobacterium sp.]|nr:hypothetical protein [Janthinobacterium sp.]
MAHADCIRSRAGVWAPPRRRAPAQPMIRMPWSRGRGQRRFNYDAFGERPSSLRQYDVGVAAPAQVGQHLVALAAATDRARTRGVRRVCAQVG